MDFTAGWTVFFAVNWIKFVCMVMSRMTADMADKNRHDSLARLGNADGIDV